MRPLQLMINAANPVPELCSIFEAYPRQIFGCLYIQKKMKDNGAVNLYSITHLYYNQLFTKKLIFLDPTTCQDLTFIHVEFPASSSA